MLIYNDSLKTQPTLNRQKHIIVLGSNEGTTNIENGQLKENNETVILPFIHKLPFRITWLIGKSILQRNPFR